MFASLLGLWAIQTLVPDSSQYLAWAPSCGVGLYLETPNSENGSV